MFSKTLSFQYLLGAFVLALLGGSATGQEQVYEHGQIIQLDERGEALDYLDEEEVVEVDDSLP